MITKKFTSGLFAALIICFLGLFSSSCNSDNDQPYVPDNVCYDFVTFVSTSDKGSVFTFRKSNDSDLITLTAAVKIDTEKIKPGTRVIIQYVPSGGQAPYESGPITLYGIAMITNGNVEAKPMSEIESWSNERVKMQTIARSGNYIDVWIEAALSQEPKHFVIVADEATMDNEYPDLYLVFETDRTMGNIRQIYGSFDMSQIWDQTTCKGVTVHYTTYNGNETVKFEKQTHIPILPGGDPIE